MQGLRIQQTERYVNTHMASHLMRCKTDRMKDIRSVRNERTVDCPFRSVRRDDDPFEIYGSLRCNIRSVNSTTELKTFNDPYESNELNMTLTDRYSAGILDMGGILSCLKKSQPHNMTKSNVTTT